LLKLKSISCILLIPLSPELLLSVLISHIISETALVLLEPSHLHEDISAAISVLLYGFALLGTGCSAFDCQYGVKAESDDGVVEGVYFVLAEVKLGA
jgi:hypothetical protein